VEEEEKGFRTVPQPVHENFGSSIGLPTPLIAIPLIMSPTRCFIPFLAIVVIIMMMAMSSCDARKFALQPRYNSIAQLHKVLNIGKDPTEDIRTNRVLNMEGF
jgi:hypothetical protein